MRWPPHPDPLRLGHVAVDGVPDASLLGFAGLEDDVAVGEDHRWSVGLEALHLAKIPPNVESGPGWAVALLMNVAIQSVPEIART
ncbi:MAG TPA: hypothetical protein VFG04_22680, partial [Planctomycetaceae bacterium]|jgi:hypothetical protein|nr:hypothetical protein [Planctomycetaceae bacterium]